MKFLRRILILVFLLILSPGGSLAQSMFIAIDIDPPLTLKCHVSCKLDENCWIVNYPDLGTGNIKDYRGGKVTFKSNKGTSIVVKTLLDIKEGVPVLSAQDGTVVFTRDDVEDNFPLEQEDPPFCGNGVIIEHNNNWKTIYCHLKKDSVRVKTGDFAKEGLKIAEMGFSGKTEFPQLYFVALHDESYYDPFTGQKLNPAEEAYKPFWSTSTAEKLDYSEVIVTNIGISDEEPTLKKIKHGDYEDIEIMQDSPSIFLWINGFHFDKNDFIKAVLKNPEQNKILEDFKMIKSGAMEQMIFFQASKPEEEVWKTGKYTGKIEFIRPDSGYVHEYDYEFEIKMPPEVTDNKELEEKEQLKQRRLIRKRKIRIFKKLKDQDQLPDNFGENPLNLLK